MNICDYGCGKEALYKFGNKWCCSKSQNSCPSKKERARQKRIGVKNLPAQPIETDELCSFGCGQLAKFIYKNGSFCCSDDWHRCSGKHDQISKQSTLIWSDLDRRKKFSETQHKDLFAVPIPVLEDDKICQDCGEKAYFWFKTNNRYCCSDRIERCPSVKEEIAQRMITEWENEEFRELMKNSQVYDEKRCRKISISQKEWFVKHPGQEHERAKGMIKFSQDHTGESLEEKFGEETASRMRKNASERILNKTYEELYGEEKALVISIKMSVKKTEHWKDPEYAKKISKSATHGMNKPESIINEIIKDLGYEFVGNFDFMIDGRNPDFIKYSKNKIIEHFGIWYHGERYRSGVYKDFTSNKEHEQKRIDHFKKNGYECLVIWENELKDIEKVIQKILEFNKD